jgi:hypothetical protein
MSRSTSAAAEVGYLFSPGQCRQKLQEQLRNGHQYTTPFRWLNPLTSFDHDGPRLMGSWAVCQSGIYDVGDRQSDCVKYVPEAVED